MCSLCDSDFPYEKGHITRTCLALVGMGREEKYVRKRGASTEYRTTFEALCFLNAGSAARQ